MGLDAGLQCQIKVDLPPKQFIPLLVTTVLEYGKLTDGHYAIEIALETAKTSIGKDKQEDCDRLLGKFREYAQNPSQQFSSRIAKPYKIAVVVIIFMFGLFSLIYVFHVKKQIIPLECFEEGVFGILVVAFEGNTAEEIAKGTQIQHDLVSTLNARFNELNICDAVAKKLQASVAASITTHEEAYRIGKKYHADLVLWGQVNSQAVIPSFTWVGFNTKFNDIFIVKQEVTFLKEALSLHALRAMQDIRFPALTDEPTLLVTFVTGLKYLSEEQYEKALQYFMASLPEKPLQYIQIGVIHAFMGIVYIENGEYDKGITELNTAIEHDPSNAAFYYFQRAIAYSDQNADDLAIADYGKSLEHHPPTEKAAGVYHNLGVVYANKGEYDTAIAYLTKAVEFDPTFYEYYLSS